MSGVECFSVCGMCTVRCPIQVDVEEGKIRFIQGNPHSPLKGALCARGAAGPALEAGWRARAAARGHPAPPNLT